MRSKWKTNDWLLLATFLLFVFLSVVFRRESLITLAVVFGLILFIRVLLILGSRLLWKIRNRLIFSSLFFTVTPILLISVFFYMIASFLVSQYNSIIFENIMQNNLVTMEKITDIHLRLMKPEKIVPELQRLARRNSRFLKICYYFQNQGKWESFFNYPADFPFASIDFDYILRNFRSGYFSWNGKLYQGVAKTEGNLAAFFFEAIDQEYFDTIPHVGDFKVMFQPLGKGSIVSQSRQMTTRLEAREFAGFEKYRLPFPFDFHYMDLDALVAAKPKIRAFWFVIINDYSQLFLRLKGTDPLRSLRQEIQALQKEIDESGAGKEKEEKFARLADMKRELETAEKNRSEGANTLIPLIIKIIIGLFGFFIVVSIFIGFRIIRVITHSVDQLTRGLERIRKGDFTFRIHIKSRDQMHFLAESFNEMTAGIDRLLKEEKEKQRLEEELRIARSIQLRLLPQDTFSTTEFAIAAVNIPAQEIAGDYFDYFYQQGRSLIVLVADVSGKGASAAFYMAELKGIMNYLQTQSESPVDMIYQCHRSLLPSFDKVTFITMNLVRFDLESKRLVFARSGHTPALFFDMQEGTCRELTPSGPAIGLSNFSKESIELVDIPFHAGDILFFYSDGLSEIMNPEGETLGVERLKSIIIDHAGDSPMQIRQKLLDFSGEFSKTKANPDDLTFVVIKIL